MTGDQWIRYARHACQLRRRRPDRERKRWGIGKVARRPQISHAYLNRAGGDEQCLRNGRREECGAADTGRYLRVGEHERTAGRKLVDISCKDVSCERRRLNKVAALHLDGKIGRCGRTCGNQLRRCRIDSEDARTR